MPATFWSVMFHIRLFTVTVMNEMKRDSKVSSTIENQSLLDALPPPRHGRYSKLLGIQHTHCDYFSSDHNNYCIHHGNTLLCCDNSINRRESRSCGGGYERQQ